MNARHIKTRIISRESHPLIEAPTVLLLEADLDGLLAKLGELESCLKWYVEEDDTNMGQECNNFWIEGKLRAQRALGMEEE